MVAPLVGECSPTRLLVELPPGDFRILADDRELTSQLDLLVVAAGGDGEVDSGSLLSRARQRCLDITLFAGIELPRRLHIEDRCVYWNVDAEPCEWFVEPICECRECHTVAVTAFDACSVDPEKCARIVGGSEGACSVGVNRREASAIDGKHPRTGSEERECTPASPLPGHSLTSGGLSASPNRILRFW
ncbi:hypothetical protein HFX_6087 (plasmid) [Haloferax mediterranei ATCC 33500]|uniref:Uncharacterized protein n=1 Tax=Haloferax mediterranei (strain ATCC 33500 / DSM 1411 / JCM 8866 / NBRC 14739 / NCIMB 2177 / R-4) TaxID=523841 RepID=I3RAF4_HALMT|nr:hypothetical protein HFX_6087 [Haloferax mediterranei ATCC 33500]